jgi:hypothetical protein
MNENPREMTAPPGGAGGKRRFAAENSLEGRRALDDKGRNDKPDFRRCRGPF